MRLVTFIEYDRPALVDGVYTVAVTHTAGLGEPDNFKATTTFAVSGERFKIDPAEIAGVFPPDTAGGEYAGVLPHALINRRTLPWERSAGVGDADAPWLAILLLDEDEMPELAQRTAKDLVQLGEHITVTGSSVTGTGAMPKGIVSYPGMNRLEYGEDPDDPVQTIDLPAQTFSRAAPSPTDLPLLAHIRRIDTIDGLDAPDDSDGELAIVLGNRIPRDGAAAVAALVSLEGLGPILPDAAGKQNPALTAEKVRLTVFRSWKFFAQTRGQAFLALLESLNATAAGEQRLTSLQIPFSGQPPSTAQVEQARADQATGALQPGDAQVLVHDALGMGYLPLPHHLRHAGETVSWYRGPLAPLPVSATVALPLAGPDAASRYNPQTGMFDVSYAAAWQLGQLLAVQDRSFALTVLAWRRGLRAGEAIAAEQQRISELLGGAFESIARRRRVALAAGPANADHPPEIASWLARMRVFDGVPFNYLVPDERMLPPESLRVFHVDGAWVQALEDGALSIGRASTGELLAHARHAPSLHAAAHAAARSYRANPAPDTDHVNANDDVTGFLLRSEVVAGWPGLSVKGFSDVERHTEIPKLSMRRISDDVLICLFDGVIAAFDVREPADQLHSGVEEYSAGQFTTSLREVKGANPGRQYTTDPKGGPPEAQAKLRTDGQTLMIAATATSIQNKLNDDFDQELAELTSAELALEIVKGVGAVGFRLAG